jgi:hypothetical protein
MQDGSLKRKVQYSWRLALLDMATLLFVAGIISTVSGSVGGSSTFTLCLILAGAAIEAIRRFSTKVITGAMVAVDLVTIFLLTGIVSNPLLWGMPAIAATLLTWVIVQSVRYFVGKSTSMISAAMQIAITCFAIHAIVSPSEITIGTTVVGLILWLLAELAWVLLDQRLFAKLKAKRVIVE